MKTCLSRVARDATTTAFVVRTESSSDDRSAVYRRRAHVMHAGISSKPLTHSCRYARCGGAVGWSANGAPSRAREGRMGAFATTLIFQTRVTSRTMR
jgi:hypothetical protein